MLIREDGRIWWMGEDGSEEKDSGGRSNLVVGGKDLVMFSSIVGATIPAVPHRLTLAATESACCLVSMAGKG